MGRRGSRTPRSVRVANIESGERKKSPLVDSILKHTNPLYRYRFVFDVGGDLVERTYAHFNGPDDGRDGSFSKLVKVYFPDGSWKYAIRGFRVETENTKSYYKPKQRIRRRPELFYLEDLLAIYDEYTPRVVGDEDNAMVWNSLDATCHGNVYA